MQGSSVIIFVVEHEIKINQNVNVVEIKLTDVLAGKLLRILLIPVAALGDFICVLCVLA